MTTQARELAKLVTNAGDVNLGDDISLASDGAVLNFGADNDVTLTHVADTGLLLNSSRQLQFGDSGTFIRQEADGVLDLTSDTEIELNATTLDINANVDISGTLTVAGALDFGDAALSNVGDVQLDSIAGDGDTNTSITFPGSDVITITTGGTAALTVDASQKVGIGTASPDDYNSHAENLVVASSGNTGISIVAGTSNDSTLMFADGTGGTAGYRGRIGYDHATDNMVFHTAAATRMQIDADGTIQLGNPATGAATNVVVMPTGKLFLDAGGNTYIQESSGDVVDFYTGGALRLKLNSSGLTADALTLNSAGVITQTVDSGGGVYQTITHTGSESWTWAAQNGSGSVDYLDLGISGGTRCMTWTDQGKVGIGTAAPSADLHLYNTNGDRPHLLLENFGNRGTGDAPILEFYLNDETTGGIGDDTQVGVITFAGDEKDSNSKEIYAQIRGIAKDPGSGSANKGTLDFMIQKDGTLTQTMALVNGRVGIGTGTPSYKNLTINSASGDAGHTFEVGGTRYWNTTVDTAGSPGSNAYWIGDQQDDNGVYVQQNGSSWSGISDERLKRNWTNITNATDKIDTLTKVGTFERRGKSTGNWSSDKEIGLSAQEVEAILPEAVSTGGDIEFASDDKVTGVKGMSYEKLVPLLVKSIQELNARIKTLEG